MAAAAPKLEKPNVVLVHGGFADGSGWHAIAGPVAEMQRLSGLPSRTLKRRFKAATGLTPIRFVQRIRVERAKRLLETTADSI